MAARRSSPSEMYAAAYDADLASSNGAQSLDAIGSLIDLSDSLGRPDGARRALERADQLDLAKLVETEAALLEYFRANAWAVLHHHEPTDSWAWEQPALGQQIFHLRKCASHVGFPRLERLRRCQVFTNLANCMDTVGRFVEAQDYWGRAIALEPKFGMAIGNRACGLENYARAHYDRGHQMLFLKFAHAGVKTALRKSTVFDGPYPHALAHFNAVRERIEAGVSNLSKVKLHAHPMGKSKAERAYRQWCLDNRLFLNPLNDLGALSIANRDILMLPSFWTKVDEAPTLVGFFNQLKQEYASARWLLYDGTRADVAHFSDRDVLLYNALDYSCHALSVEKIKIAFRMAYSLFDKMAFFLNEYLQLGVNDRDVYFKTIWYQHRSAKPYPLRPAFVKLDNWSFRGLFWLAKDLFDEHSSDVIAPEARDLYVIRNRMEHSGFKVHEDFANELSRDHEIFSSRLSYSIARSELREKTIHLFKLVRAAMIYMLLGMHREEARQIRDEKAPTLLMEITTLDDAWKL